tara:strand:+ start:258 stop:497 length:240 start_codon:yes stop_codon:yes gene_type:complete
MFSLFLDCPKAHSFLCGFDSATDIQTTTLFVMNCLFAMYLRISELVEDERSNPVMGDFRKDHDSNWWLHVGQVFDFGFH